MSAKLNKIELSEEFMAMRRKEQTLWDGMSPLYPHKNEKDKSFKRSHREVFHKSFTKFTGKHLCQSLFFNKVAGLAKFLRIPFLQNTSG